ncbi:MAG: CTP synthase [candidate division WOR-3 bacterium]
MSQAKFIFVTGGVVSSLGKGIVTASIGLLLKSRGLKVNLLKLDPYINVDPGTMSPFQHGEVFITEDGAETDLDLGHYERFLNENLTKENNLTAGQVYLSVIDKERAGAFLGGTIQVVPHITGEIKERIRLLAEGDVDCVIVEIGGTVGDIEGLPFLEAARQLALEEGKDSVLFVHLTFVPFLRSVEEFKTKPTQHSVKELREIGIQPDIIIYRTERPLPTELRNKIALFCNVRKEAVIEAVDTPNIYRLPLIFHEEKLDWLIFQYLGLKGSSSESLLTRWQDFVNRLDNPKEEIEIGFCGKYLNVKDAYKSVIEAFRHASAQTGIRVKIRWLDSENLEESGSDELLSGVDGVLVPGGFGARGMMGKINAISYARRKKIPYLGLCVGLQCAVIEFTRNVCGLTEANSTEFDPATPYPVIYLMEEHATNKGMGGTLRRGAYPCLLKKESLAHRVYGINLIYERHRHRYEVNQEFLPIAEKHGLVASGLSPDGKLVEVIELRDSPFFIATQFHPEFKSRPLSPHPLFVAFLNAALDYRKEKRC